LAVTFATIFSGAFISKTGIAAPIAPVGAAIATIAAGLLYTLDIGTGAGKWIGYQILGGVAWGAAFQVPIIVGQATSKPEDLSSVTAIILFFQTTGGALFVSAAQSAFINTLLLRIPEGIDRLAIIGTGATAIRSVFPAELIPGILEAYMAGIKTTFAITVAGVGAAFVISLLNKWDRLNREAVEQAGAV